MGMAPLLNRLEDHVGVDSSGHYRTQKNENNGEPDDSQPQYATNKCDLERVVEH
jgi:hypothetical protein